MTDISQKQGGWTPGEWEISEARTVDDEFMVCGGEGQGFGLIATVTRKDDARLIAAAPDLAAVSQRVAVRQIDGAWYVTIFGDDTGFWSARLPDDMIAPAREFEVARQSALSRANPSTDQEQR